MDIKKIKRGIYISSFGVAVSILVVIMQVLTPMSMMPGIAILFANITILLVNASRYKAYKKTEEIENK